jgi:hypothetical protein
VLNLKSPDDIPKVVFKEYFKPYRYGQVAMKRPKHYIRYIEPSEEQLKDICEYDMDEQDVCWLKEINKERRAEDVSEISEITFEKIIDQLEKEWFHLVFYHYLLVMNKVRVLMIVDQRYCERVSATR